MRALMLFLLTLFPAVAQEYTVTALSSHLLTNQSVVDLAKAGFDELFIVERIHTSRTDFDTSIEGLVALKQAGVSEDLIRVMALQDLHNYPTPIEAKPAGAVETGPVKPEKNWWGFRWLRVFNSR